jgi:starch synthase
LKWPEPSSFENREEYLPKLLFVTSELADFVKVGGLGDVSSALPRALRQTNDIRVLIPGYRQVLAGRSITEVARFPAFAGLPACSLGRIDMPDGLIVYTVLCPELYDRDGTPYADATGADWPDNDIRFARLSLVAADIVAGVRELGWKPDLLHVNDWETGLAPAYLAWRGIDFPSVMTVHNLAYQGTFDPNRLAPLGIPENSFGIDGVEFHGRISFLKAGIFYASHVTTVSQTYASEITTPEHGCGLDGLLHTRASQNRLSGILNGVDESWDSARDPALPAPFDSATLGARSMNAIEARQAFGLGLSRGPLFSIISRLVHQKGIDLAIEAAENIVEQGGQLAVTGQGEPQFEEALRDLESRNPGKVGVRIGFDEAEARCLFAGSDFLLMPSRFEPCGLSQMYAQRYGSLPVAYKTGGLADTIEDGVTGFLFSELSLDGLMDGVARAFESFGSKKKLNEMRRRAMASPANWLQSARRYNGLYQQLTFSTAPAA